MYKNTKTLRKPSLAIIFSSNFESWPTGGMLSFVLEILPWLREHFQIELWGAKVDNRVPQKFVEIEGEKFPIYYFYQAKTKRKLIPNFLKAMIGIRKFKKKIAIEKIRYFILPRRTPCNRLWKISHKKTFNSFTPARDF